MNRQCKREWLEKFPEIAYSKKNDGLYCLACVLFPTPGQSQRGNAFIDRPYQNWKDAIEDLTRHCHLHYHLKSNAKLNAFLQTYQDPVSRIDQRLSTKTSEQVEKNRRFLMSVMRCIEYCGRQGISLRGHRDDEGSTNSNQGNFRALLDLRVSSGDEDLKSHLETCAKNARYISKTSQNELIVCMKEYIQEQIINDIQNQSSEFGSSFYAVEADEVRDVSNVEQLGIVVRYVKENTPVEVLLEFEQCEETTGAAICQKLVTCLNKLDLDPQNCRAQTYDGAGNMAGATKGCAANFMKIKPRANYYQCASHSLNLALCKASKLPEVQIMMDTLKSVAIFFKYSPQRQQCPDKATANNY